MVSQVAALDEEEQFHAPLPAAEAPQPNPIASVVRAMRGRWTLAGIGAFALGAGFSVVGFLSGAQVYESQAILRVYPQESNILYATGDESVLKTFDSFVKAETTYVASHQVMARAIGALSSRRPDLTADMKASDLSGSIDIKRVDSLIVLKTRSQDAAFASQKLDAVVESYLALKQEADEARNAVRLTELRNRDAELVERLEALRRDQLDVGGEFGLNALAKAHVEKIAQVDALAARKAEVAATLAALESSTGASSADTSDQEIMRATLLDRAMADLNFERAKLMAELAGMRSGYEDHRNLRFQRREESKLAEIAVIEQAITDRREQIRVLGQTGALTDVGAGTDKTTLSEIRSLYEKVSVQLSTALREARDLNRRRIELDRIEHELGEAEGLLEETRRALEVIRLETGRALPGYAVLMSPPLEPQEPAEDTSKMFAAAGGVGGAGLALLVVLVMAFRERKIRFGETLVNYESRLRVLQVSDADHVDPHAADLLRNELQLHSLRKPRLVGNAPVISVTRASVGETSELAASLAQSFARARMKTLFVEADLGKTTHSPVTPGWRDLLFARPVQPQSDEATPNLWRLYAGVDDHLGDSEVSAPMVRAAIEKLTPGFDVIIISVGCLPERLSAKLILSNSDVGVLAFEPSDNRDAIFAQIDHLDSLPRNGSVAVMRKARINDPWLAIRT